MSTPSQISANQQNAQHSTGPKTDEGKAASCLNNFRYGFTGAFTVLPSEDQEEFDTLFSGLNAEHRPATVTEIILIEKMAQHVWLSKRAQTLQDLSMDNDLAMREQEPMDEPATLSEAKAQKTFALFLRYQTTNDRGFHTCLNQLLKLRAEKRRVQIGFESQKRREAEEARQAAQETRQQQLHKQQLWMLQAKNEHQELQNSLIDPGYTDPKKRVQRILEHEKAA